MRQMTCDWTVRPRQCAGEHKTSQVQTVKSFSVLMQKKKVHKGYVICNKLDDFNSPLC